MNKRQVLINAIISIVQIIVTSVVLFVLYRFLLHTLGVEQLGVWSLVLATTSVTQIANLGLSGSVVKFVAKYVARGEDEKVSSVMQTAILSLAPFVGIILIVCYPVARWLLGLVITGEFLPHALAILPYTFWALWLLIITSIFQAGLDGYQRIDLRGLLLIGGVILHLFLCFLLAPAYGLMGIAYARVIQNITVLLGSIFLLRRCLPVLPALPYKWDKATFKEIINYGLNFQLISVINMFFDPMTKAFLSKFGGLSMVGFYEMASKMVQQFRLLIVSANQVLVPAIADLKEKSPEKIRSVYMDSYRLLFYLALPLYSLLIVCIPAVSVIWIGYYESTFVVFGTLVAIAWFLNTLNVPAYFMNLGTGDLRWNIAGHVVVTLLHAIFGFLFGYFYGGKGVVVSQVFSMALGSSVIFLSYNIKNSIPLLELLPKANNMLSMTCLISTLLTLLLYYRINHLLNSIAAIVVVICVFSILISVPFWLHPMRMRMTELINKELLNKETGA